VVRRTSRSIIAAAATTSSPKFEVTMRLARS
jgi:hypothetical protein